MDKKKQDNVNKIKQKSITKKSDSRTLSSSISDLMPTSPDEHKALEGIFKILLKSSRVNFVHYRQSTVLRRLTRRVGLCKKETFQEYLSLLENKPNEIELLYDDLLLSFTEFFRDPHVFETLKVKICPRLTENRPAKSPIRVWVPGCSTGEEVYSLAICFHEYLEKSKSNATAQFFGTDLVERHIVAARTALYPDKIRKYVSEERIERFFDQTGDGLKVSKFIREMCVFASQDVTQDPPFPNIDLVSCRNLLIYFNEAFQETAMPLFHFSLKPTGYLLLGTSETMGRFPHLFNSFDQKANVFTKVRSRTKPLYRFPVSPTISKYRNTYEKISTASPGKASDMDITKRIDEILLDIYAPPGILVDSNMQIRHFRGITSPYIQPSKGEASFKLSKMAEEGLIPDLYVAIEEAKKKQGKIRKRNITFKQGNEIKTIDISVIPITDSFNSDIHYLILFTTIPY